MTPEYIELIKATIPVLRESGVALTTYFYERMLKNEPELKNTFNLDNQKTGMQPRALAGAVLAYAENIENPAVLAKAVERITTKHVSLNIQPEQYEIVGTHLLHSISEVLDVPMESDLIAAWKEAYLQLAALLIDVEKGKYAQLSQAEGAWTGWREFKISAIELSKGVQSLRLTAVDGQAVANAEAGDYINVRVAVPERDFKQPQSFSFKQAQSGQYVIDLTNEVEASDLSVNAILATHAKVGDVVEVSAPVKL